MTQPNLSRAEAPHSRSDDISPNELEGRDELLECLKVIASFHQHEVSSEALRAGLPLEQGKLTPSVFGRAASRAGLTARITKSRLSGLNPALFPVILLLEPGRACVLLGLDLKQKRARVIFSRTLRVGRRHFLSTSFTRVIVARLFTFAQSSWLITHPSRA